MKQKGNRTENFGAFTFCTGREPLSHYKGAMKASAFRSVWLAGCLWSMEKACQRGRQEEVLQKPEWGLRGRPVRGFGRAVGKTPLTRPSSAGLWCCGPWLITLATL